MPLLGPDGKPLTPEDEMKDPTLHTGNGVPCLDDVPMIPHPVLLDLISRLEGSIAQGTPLNTPSAVEIGLLCSLVRTIKVQREVLVKQKEDAQKTSGSTEPPLPTLRDLTPDTSEE